MAIPSREPPRFVPTLTEVVQPATAYGPYQAPLLQSPPALPTGVEMEEQIVHRVMQRVDVVLEYRLHEVITQVVHEQTRSIVPRLREEIESVVRQSVYEAVAEELADSLMDGKRS